MWLFTKQKHYLYFKSVHNHYYGLCGVTIKYTKEKYHSSFLKYMTTIKSMENKGFKEITKQEYIKGVDCEY